ncbi:EamA family transporter [Croceiramulus getboli]|nr:DMT family transporter [Flavobacteriaceae bacterium YJPT1-3]
MIYLLLSIGASTLIFVVFKLFARFQVNTFQAIVVNYLVACLSGLIAYGNPISPEVIAGKAWFIGCLVLGVLFIAVFNLMALTTQRSGLSVVSVATKMSVVVPVLFGILYYKEALSGWQILGILLALVAVYLASARQKSTLQIDKKYLWLPVLVFLGSGIIDTSIKFLEGAFVSSTDVPIFSATIFACAALCGILSFGVQAVRGQFHFAWKSVIGGIALGIPNYFSIYYLVQALRSSPFASSTLFTINNVGIVMLSTLLGIAFFKERLLRKNWIGIVLAILSIILISLPL